MTQQDMTFKQGQTQNEPKPKPVVKTDPKAAAKAAKNAGGGSEKRNRRPGGAVSLGPLALDESLLDPNLVYRWILDNPGAVNRYTKQDDYFIVDNKDNAHASISEGTHVTRASSGGEGMILVAKRRDWFNKDQIEKSKAANEIDRQIKAGGKAVEETGMSYQSR